MSSSSLEHRQSFEDDSTVAASSHHRHNATNQSQSDNMSVTCSRCQKPATYMCSSCGLSGPRYCSVECQKADWKEKHGSVCQATEAARQARRATRGLQLNNNTRDNHNNANNTTGDIALNDLSASATTEDSSRREDAAMIVFYMQQIYYVIKPVVACIVLSIFWVKVAFSGSSDYKPTRSSYGIAISSDTTTTASSAGTGDSSGGGGGGTSPLVGSLATALIIIGQIILVTVVILFLFKKGWMKALVGFFMIVVLLLLGFISYLLLLNLIQVFTIPMDYITMVFALWNFTVVGLVSVFYAGPLWLQQSYLTVMSSLMAFSLTGLEEWTTWFLLGLLAVWDLIAVLCPFGPLRLLIESSRSQQRDVPALLYSVNAVWFMLASSNHLRLSRTFDTSNNVISPVTATTQAEESNLLEKQPTQPAGDDVNDDDRHVEEKDTPIPSRIRSRAITATSLPDTLHSTATTAASEYEASVSSTAPLQMNNSFLTQSPVPFTSGTELNATGNQIRLRAEDSPDHDPDTVPADQQPLSPNLEDHEGSRNSRESGENDRDREEQNRRNSSGRDEDEERDGLKLGLGDFVFYSVLIARAALYDWITTICCTIAVLTGLTATIFLLAIYKRALPALPISIAFGVLFYFVAKTVLVPYISALCVFDMVGL